MALTSEELKSTLWDAANTLRGSAVDRTDWKVYILPLLFFKANPDSLFRVFGTADWGNREKFTDELLKDLIEGFSAISLGNKAVATDVLGDAYEYLVGKFADVTRRNKAGEFYTPRSVVRMMVEILDPKEGESIYDPACGTGGMLLGAIEHVTRKGGDPRTLSGKT